MKAKKKKKRCGFILSHLQDWFSVERVFTLPCATGEWHILLHIIWIHTSVACKTTHKLWPVKASATHTHYLLSQQEPLFMWQIHASVILQLKLVYERQWRWSSVCARRTDNKRGWKWYGKWTCLWGRLQLYWCCLCTCVLRCSVKTIIGEIYCMITNGPVYSSAPLSEVWKAYNTFITQHLAYSCCCCFCSNK